MSPRELVCRTLRFEPTPRVPRNLWVLPWAEAHYPAELASIRRDFPDDFEYARFDLPNTRGGDPYAAGTYVDEWGCEFLNASAGTIGQVKKPMVVSYASDLDKVRPPAEWAQVSRDEINRQCAVTDRFMLASPGINPFERMQFLRGTEQLFLDLLEQPAGLLRLRDRVHEWNLAVLDAWLRTDVDAVCWSDDWVMQDRLLIAPELWRELFKPLYCEYARRVRAAGKFAFMHSDGNIFEIYADLIEVGVNAINSQLFCMDIEDIGRRFRGRITFWGEIDRQRLLAYGSPEQVQAAVRRVSQTLYMGRGGVIAQCEFGPGARPENVRAVFEEWNKI